ncbi:hypothetical protein HZH66_001552 [Vespula vulgaris]|uniref:Uncharacterized protein n=1 Tax=Vespula vulgaris TaxID=7454 RepID=A0A834KTB3_VESVU|nr:hypothetical protein HZH66_001552 [Vespula vulgaris]
MRYRKIEAGREKEGAKSRRILRATYDIHILGIVCLWLEGRAAFPPGKRRGWLWVSWRLPMEVAGGWQSVEASGADQWPDGASPGILTL